MSKSETNSGVERFCTGDPLEYAIRGVKEIPSRTRRSNKTLSNPIKERYGTNISDDTANVVERLYNANDGRALVQAVKQAGLDDVDDYSVLLSGCDLDDDEDADLGRVMQELDVRLTESLASRESDASNASKKANRESVYVPDVINAAGDEGTVYMAKTLSTTAKVRMAHDLHDDNQVLVVDDYEKWENLLGWEKLKQFPHGKNQIREELGDKLSDEVLDIVAGNDTGSDTDTKDDSGSTGSRGRRTRTKPSDEVLNVAIGSRHRNRTKIKSEDIKDQFEDDGYIGGSYNPIKMLVLFPTTTDLNMTDHWWVAGNRFPDGGYVAIANCNKGTFEYLNQRDEVWHIEDYLEQASDYEFQTNHGPVTLGTIDTDNLVMHVITNKLKDRLMRDTVMPNMPSVLPEYCDNELYRAPSFPHEDDMLYAPITLEDVFWMRPELRKQQNPEEGDAVILYADVTIRDLGNTYSLSSDYKLYARARLPDWDFDSTEMTLLDNASYKLDLDRGGYELVETLGMLHDAGKEPFSEMPQSRWQ